jgi:hypothetical protein
VHQTCLESTRHSEGLGTAGTVPILEMALTAAIAIQTQVSISQAKQGITEDRFLQTSAPLFSIFFATGSRERTVWQLTLRPIQQKKFVRVNPCPLPEPLGFAPTPPKFRVQRGVPLLGTVLPPTPPIFKHAGNIHAARVIGIRRARIGHAKKKSRSGP